MTFIAIRFPHVLQPFSYSPEDASRAAVADGLLARNGRYDSTALSPIGIEDYRKQYSKLEYESERVLQTSSTCLPVPACLVGCLHNGSPSPRNPRLSFSFQSIIHPLSAMTTRYRVECEIHASLSPWDANSL